MQIGPASRTLLNPPEPSKSLRKPDFKEREKYFKRGKTRKSNFKEKKKSFGYTNNPKYFGKKPGDGDLDFTKRKSSFKSKKKYKNRKRPKNFSFKRFRKKN